ncbi:hypothetical protein [Janthinobacterium rivuli]|uniref:hypothetical protein n=1 Tax=Janthinobacterium rivuli TaxID=2751478 RepID=UPI00383AF2CD
MKTKNISRLLFWFAGSLVLALGWAGRILIQLLALCAADNAERPQRDARERRYSWDNDGYSWEGRPDEME